MKKNKIIRLAAVVFTLVIMFALMNITTVAAAGDVAINATNFPDANFRKYVQDKIDTDKNGVLSETEIAGATYITVNGKAITSLKGIEHFTELTYLLCYENRLTSLDVSKNTKLKTLNCSFNNLTSLDVSKNTELTFFDCRVNNIASLDVSNNTKVEDLYCDTNRLTSLDVSKNVVLEKLYCYDNQLTTLVISSTTLKELHCEVNLQMTSLDVSGCPALVKLVCNTNKLTSLDVSKNTALEELVCSVNQLTSLDVSKNTALKYLECSSNNLTNLDVSNNTKLTKLFCSNNKFDIIPKADRTFDLSTLPGNFDVTKASNWTGGTVSGNILTVEAGDGIVTYKTATYNYDAGNGKTVMFTLTFTPHNHSYGDWQYDANSHWKECVCKEKISNATHNVKIVGAKEETTTETGYTGDKVCSVCGYVVEKGEEIPVHVHDYGDWQYDADNHWKECGGCGEKDEMTAHNIEVVGAKEATETETGYTGDKVCKDCGFVAETGEEIPVHVHIYDGELSFNSAGHWEECNCGEKEEPVEHVIEVVGEKQATMIQAGYTGDKVCKDCGYVEEEGEEIPATGSDFDISKIIDKIKDMSEKIDPEAISGGLNQIKDILGKIDPEVITGALEQAKPAIDKIVDFIGSIFDSEDETPTNPSAKPDGDNSTGNAGTGDSAGNTDKNDSEQTPDTNASGNSDSKVPDTGAVVGTAAFAILSVAAAAAFVSKKKKD